ncbi:unnamed protein product [Paramecium octaurelia]|uniref:Cyclin-like domain-containing protein n=1 Tax=Paramecium octaurelia TaxID=43137 RepID=A0A8S1Y1P7_PAROT|nr:unnamed protein product [Paramecium octaurelia]
MSFAVQLFFLICTAMFSFAELRDLITRDKPKTFNKHNPYYSYDSVSPSRRDILIQWIIAQSSQFQQQIKTLELAVLIIDTYLNYFNISQEYLQLLGISAYSIASKFYETEISYQIKLYDQEGQPLYKDEEYNEMEEQIVKAMGYQLNLTTSSDYLSAMNVEIDEKVQNLLMFILIDYEIYQYSHFELALAILHYLNDARLVFSKKILIVSQLIHKKLIKAQEISCDKYEEDTKSVGRSPSVQKRISKKRDFKRQRLIKQQI